MNFFLFFITIVLGFPSSHAQECQRNTFIELKEIPPTFPDQLDVIFVIDNSNTMKKPQEALKAALQTIQQNLVESGSRFRIAVLTTDGLLTSEYKVKTRIPLISKKVLYLDETQFQSDAELFETRWNQAFNVGIQGGSNESFFDPVDHFLSEHAQSFLRPNTPLLLIALSDTDDRRGEHSVMRPQDFSKALSRYLPKEAVHFLGFLGPNDHRYRLGTLDFASQTLLPLSNDVASLKTSLFSSLATLDPKKTFQISEPFALEHPDEKLVRVALNDKPISYNWLPETQTLVLHRNSMDVGNVLVTTSYPCPKTNPQSATTETNPKPSEILTSLLQIKNETQNLEAQIQADKIEREERINSKLVLKETLSAREIKKEIIGFQETEKQLQHQLSQKIETVIQPELESLLLKALVDAKKAVTERADLALTNALPIETMIPPDQKKLPVCIVIDTSGSMGGFLKADVQQELNVVLNRLRDTSSFWIVTEDRNRNTKTQEIEQTDSLIRAQNKISRFLDQADLAGNSYMSRGIQDCLEKQPLGSIILIGDSGLGETLVDVKSPVPIHSIIIVPNYFPTYEGGTIAAQRAVQIRVALSLKKDKVDWAKRPDLLDAALKRIPSLSGIPDLRMLTIDLRKSEGELEVELEKAERMKRTTFPLNFTEMGRLSDRTGGLTIPIDPTLRVYSGRRKP